MKLLCINLNRSRERWTFMEGQFNAFDFRGAGIEVERMEGVDGAANVPAWLRAEFAGPHELTTGEVGCYASHLMIAQTVVAQSLPCAVVLEDDVTLDEDFPLICRQAVDGAPAGWDYIHLSSVVKRSVLAERSLSGGRALIRYSRLPVNTAAYILSNSGARKWLAPMPRCRPNDIDIRYAWLADLDVLGVYPAPARQADNFPSEIGGTHAPQVYDPRSFSPGPLSELYLEWWTGRRLGLAMCARARLANVVNSARRRLDGKRRVAILKRA